MADFRINVIIDPRGATRGGRQVRRELRGIETAADRVRTSLVRAFGAISVTLAVRELGRLADAYTGIQNRLRTVIDSQEEVNQVTDQLFQIANRTRGPVEALTELYQRGSIAANELGASQDDLLRFTELVGNALAIQGGSAQSAAGALTQLSQSLGSGIVRAEEFNSILEGAFPIAQAAAQGIDEAGGSVARLRQLVVDGEITSRQFFDALLSQADALQETFANTVPTISQAFTVLRNNILQFVGETDQASGASRRFAEVILLAAENVDVLANALLAIGAVIATNFVARGLQSAILLLTQFRAGLTATIPLVRALTLALLANPFGIIATAIASVIALIATFGNGLAAAENQAVTFGDIFAEAWERILGAVQSVVEFFQTNFPGIVAVATNVFNNINLSFEGLIRGLATGIDTLIGVFAGAWAFIETGAQNAAAALGNAFIDIFQAVADRFTNFINGFIRGFNQVANFFGREGIGEFGGITIGNGGFEGAGQSAAEAFGEALTNSTAATDAVDGFFDAVNQRAFEREEDLAFAQVVNNAVAGGAAPPGTPPGDDGSGGGGGAARAAADAINEQNDALERQRDLLDEIRGPGLELAQRQADLQTLFDQGAISVDEFTRAMRDLNVEASALDNTFSGGLQNGIDRIIQRANDLGSEISNFVVGAFDQATDAIVEFAKTGEFNVREFFASLAEQLLRIATNQLFASLLGGFGGGGALGSLFGGGGGGFLGGLFGFQNGGSFNVGGSGGTDSQLVAFRATPGEEVNVRTPGQVAAGMSGGGMTNINQNTTNVAAVLSPSDITDTLNTSEGETTIINLLQKNATTVQQIARG